MGSTQTWGVIEVGGQLVHNTGRHAFQVMRTKDAEAALDALVEKAASAVKLWREYAETVEAMLEGELPAGRPGGKCST